LSGIDAVVHLAALSNDPVGDLAERHTYDINHVASVRLAELARSAGVGRFVYSSTCSVYGASDVSRPVDETSPMNPVTAYAKSKILVEGELRDMTSPSFSPVFLRNATAYGVSPHLRTDLVLNNLVASAYLTGRIIVTSDGTPWRPLVHIRDISAAVLAVLTAPAEEITGEAYNVGHENFQVRAIAEIVGEQFPDCDVEITGAPNADNRSYRVDFSKIQSAFPDLRFEWTVQKGAAELAAAYKAIGLTDDDVQLRFARLPWLQTLRKDGSLDDNFRWAVVRQ
jgi:nucleoside-diphosphate-sugar epimerase